MTVAEANTRLNRMFENFRRPGAAFVEVTDEEIS
jgi:hypothetical protein